MMLVIVVRLALFVLLNIQTFSLAIPASSSSEGSGNESFGKKHLRIDDPRTVSILKKNQPISIQNKISEHINQGKRQAAALNHQCSTQALNVVALTARQNHPDAWTHIFHKDNEVTNAIWDRAHREMSNSKKVGQSHESSSKGKQPTSAADHGSSTGSNRRPNIPKPRSKPEKGRSRSN